MQQSSIKYLIKKSNNTLKKSNTMIKWVLFQGGKGGTT
jgi:hypothetical protein